MFIFCGKFGFTFSTGLDVCNYLGQVSSSFIRKSNWLVRIVMSKWAKDWRFSQMSDWLSTVQLKKHWDVWEVQKGVSLNGGTPISHPKMMIFSRKIHGCWVPPFQETPIYKTESNAFVQPRSSSVQATFCWKGDDSVRILSCPWDPRDWYIYRHFTIKIKHSCR